MFEMSDLLTIADPVPLDTLNPAQLTELQRGLSALGYPIARIDGLNGPNTRNSWAEFMTDVSPGNPTLVGSGSLNLLAAKTADIAKNLTVPAPDEASVKDAIVRQCGLAGLGLKTQIAYVLATVEWETAQTFRPVREDYWLSEDWRKAHLSYAPYYGRGYVQLTWQTNYAKYAEILALDLVNNPDLALEHGVALFVVVHGFQTGVFTGRKLPDYVNASHTDFVNARRCINGTDHATEIAALAQRFLNGLQTATRAA